MSEQSISEMLRAAQELTADDAEDKLAQVLSEIDAALPAIERLEAENARLEAAARFFRENPSDEHHSETHWMNEWPTPYEGCDFCRHSAALAASDREEGGGSRCV